MSAQADSSERPQGPKLAGAAAPARKFDRRERWLAALFFALVIVLAFPQVVFLGRSLVPTDNMNPLDYRYVAANYGPHVHSPTEWSQLGLQAYPNFHDPGGSWWQGEPALEFFRKAIFSGQFPFWDPSAAGGVSAYTNLQCQFLFPPQIALSLLGSTSTEKNIYILLLFWTAGFATYCLLRMHGLVPLASAAGGLVFLFSGALQQIGPSIFMGQVVACIPLLLLVTRWFIDQPLWRRSAGLAATYAVVALASFPPILCAGFGCAVFYLLFALVLERPVRWIRLLSRFAVGVALSLGMVTVYYLPAFITVAHTPYVTQWYQGAALDFLAPKAIFDLLSPTATGGALIYLSPIMGGDVGHLYYVGVSGLLLAGLAFGRCQGRSRTLLVASSVVAALALLKIFGVPPVQWIARLPGSQSIHYHLYFGILVAFLISLLAALGFDRLLRGRAGLQVLASICVLGLGTRILWVLARESGALRPHQAWRWIADYRLLIWFGASFALLAGVMLLRQRWNKMASLAACLLLGLVFVEGVVNTTYPRQARWDVFAHPPNYVSVVQQLQRPARLFIAAALNANLASAFGLETWDSLYMFSPPWMYDIYQQYAAPAAAISMREATVLPPEAVLDRAGISHVLIRQKLPGLFAATVMRSYAVAYADDYVCLFRRAHAMPRYVFSSEYQVTDHAAALKLIGTTPRQEILLESAPPFLSSRNSVDDPGPELVSAKLNSLTLRVAAPRPGLLYMADAYFDGWSATVNGVSTPILPANYAFRAVAVPAGDVLVKLSYLPKGFLVGLIVSMVSVIATVTLLLRREVSA